MKGFEEKDGLPYPSYVDVYRLFSQQDVYQMYLNVGFRLGTINSPIGEEDKRASLSFFYNYNKDKFMFKEHRYGYFGDCIDFVRHLFGYQNNRRACMRIMHDFGIEEFAIDQDIKAFTSPGKVVHTAPIAKPVNRNTNLKVQIRKWQKYDLDYWAQYGITLPWLKRANIFPIIYYFINNYMRYAEKYSYVFIERKDGKFTYKVYQPFADKNRKWFNNNNNSVWELWTMLPEKGERVIITKSRKDALSIMSTIGIPSSSLQSEGAQPKPQIITELKQRFNMIYIMYDNDFNKKTNYGLNFSSKLASKYNLKHIILPEKFGEKDYSDLVKRYGVKKASGILTTLLK